MTTLCWWLNDAGDLMMLLTESICWRLLLLCNTTYVALIKSPTSSIDQQNLICHPYFIPNIRQQHRCNLRCNLQIQKFQKNWNCEKFKWADVLVNFNSVTFEVKKTIVGECLKYWGGIFSEKDWRSDYVNPPSGQVLFEMFKLIRNSCVTIL